jgi:transaldolase
VAGYPAVAGPGVLFATRVFNYFQQHGHPTVDMGANFRNVEEILRLVGYH